MIEIKLPDLSRVRLEPGDVLVVRVQGAISMKTAQEIRVRVGEHFPNNDVVVLSQGVELAVVRPADGERVAAPPSPSAIAELFAEANDRPEHIGPA